MQFGDKILLLRKFAGFLQKELGDEIGVTESRISEYEKDKYAPNPETLYKIAKVCRMHVGYFYDSLSPEEYYQVAKHLKYAYYLSALPDDVKRFQRRMLKFAYELHNKDLDGASKEITNTKAPKLKNAKRKIIAFHEDYFNELKKRSIAHFEKLNQQ